ncbi:unnamed protein product [Gadus morhua 'NCC']
MWVRGRGWGGGGAAGDVMPGVGIARCGGGRGPDLKMCGDYRNSPGRFQPPSAAAGGELILDQASGLLIQDLLGHRDQCCGHGHAACSMRRITKANVKENRVTLDCRTNSLTEGIRQNQRARGLTGPHRAPAVPPLAPTGSHRDPPPATGPNCLAYSRRAVPQETLQVLRGPQKTLLRTVSWGPVLGPSGPSGKPSFGPADQTQPRVPQVPGPWSARPPRSQMPETYVSECRLAGPRVPWAQAIITPQAFVASAKATVGIWGRPRGTPQQREKPKRSATSGANSGRRDQRSSDGGKRIEQPPLSETKMKRRTQHNTFPRLSWEWAFTSFHSELPVNWELV